MSAFKKIINRLSSQEKIYTTPFLNIEFIQSSSFEEDESRNNETIKKHKDSVSKILEKSKKLEKEKDILNKKALTEKLSKAENNKLASVFSALDKNKRIIERSEQAIEYLSPMMEPEDDFNF